MNINSDTEEYYGGTYPEPDWCYKSDDENNNDDYDSYVESREDDNR